MGGTGPTADEPVLGTAVPGCTDARGSHAAGASVSGAGAETCWDCGRRLFGLNGGITRLASIELRCEREGGEDAPGGGDGYRWAASSRWRVAAAVDWRLDLRRSSVGMGSSPTGKVGLEGEGVGG